MVGHPWASKLLITCRVIKVIPIYICFSVSYLSEISYLQLCSVHVKFVWHVNVCYGMLHCLCSGLVEVILTVQGQHKNSRKYTNSYTINDECRQLSVWVLQCKRNEISIPHVNWYAWFFEVCNLIFSTCSKVCSIHGTEVVLKTRRNPFFLWNYRDSRRLCNSTRKYR
jgi:hypothetical protein